MGKKISSNPNNEQNVYKNHSAFNKFTNLNVNSNKNINKEGIKIRANCKSADEDKVIERATQIVMYVMLHKIKLDKTLVFGWFRKFLKSLEMGNVVVLFIVLKINNS